MNLIQLTMIFIIRNWVILMNNVLSLFETTLDSKVKLQTNPLIVIEENNSNAMNKKVQFKKTSKAIVFSLEDISHKKFFSSIKGLRKVNDGNIICSKEGKLFVLLVELKSDNPAKANKQIKCAMEDIKYIISILRIWYPDIIAGDLVEKIEFRGIIFSSRSGSRSRMVKSDRKAKYSSGTIPIAEASGNAIHHLDGFLY